MILEPADLTDALRADLTELLRFGPRSPDREAAQAATIEFIAASLKAYGYEVEIDRFGPAIGDCNILAEHPGDTPGAPLLEIGAHYDTVPGSPGADDNGSGVVGLLAIARQLAGVRLARPVRFCCFGCEETGLGGSKAHQARLTREARAFAGAVIFEMIGYISNEPESQFTPLRVPLLFDPPRIGDFLAVIGNISSRHLVAMLERPARAMPFRLKTFTTRLLGSLLRDAARSDHASYWRAGRPAIMLTDTANFRCAHYHQPSDTIERIDFTFLAQVTSLTLAAAHEWAAAPSP